MSELGKLEGEVYSTGIERFEHGLSALGTQRNTDAVFATGIDPQGHTLLAIHEYLNNGLIDKHAQLQWLALIQGDLGRFRRACTHVRKDGRTRIVQRNHAGQWSFAAARGAVTQSPLG